MSEAPVKAGVHLFLVAPGVLGEGSRSVNVKSVSGRFPNTHTLWHWHAASVLRDPVVRGTTRRDAPRMSTRSPAAAPVTSMFRSKFSPVSISGRDERTRMTLTASPMSNSGTAGAGVAATVPVAAALRPSPPHCGLAAGTRFGCVKRLGDRRGVSLRSLPAASYCSACLTTPSAFRVPGFASDTRPSFGAKIPCPR